MDHPTHPDLTAFADQFRVAPGSKVNLERDFDPGYVPEGLTKSVAGDLLQQGIEHLSEQQVRLYAQDIHALLVVVQAMDAAGKDSTIKHVMSGINPQGCQVFSFKVPSAEEMDHDYLWRFGRALPERGRIGIFNRSHYEDVLVVRVHPEILARAKLPEAMKTDAIWEHRFEQMNGFEKHLTENCTHVLKFFLHVSKEEQRTRFLERIDAPEKNWKFALGDIDERAYWDDYMFAYQEVLNHTSTEWSPWYVVPADHKWFTRLVVAAVICDKLHDLAPELPVLDDAKRGELEEARARLLAEG